MSSRDTPPARQCGGPLLRPNEEAWKYKYTAGPEPVLQHAACHVL